MKIICSYCRKEMGVKEPLGDDSLTHSVCPECYRIYTEQLSGVSYDKYLDRFDLPVLIVDSDIRIAASNRKAREVLGKTEREVTGLLGGEAMECQYARLKEGCGNTVHCAACTFRNTINQIIKTGHPVSGVPTYLDREDKRLTHLVSGRMEEGCVVLTLEGMT